MPNYCAEGANCTEFSNPLESQMSVPFRIGYSLYFSIYAEDETDPTHNETLHDQLREYGRGNMHHHKEIESEGEGVNEGMDEMVYRYVDCNKCDFNIDTFKVEDYSMMKKKLDHGLNELYEMCLDYTDDVHTFDLYVNLGGYDLISDLVGVTQYILSGKNPKRSIDDNRLLSHAKRKFSDKFQKLKAKGWTITVSHTSISSAFEVFGDGEKAIERQRKKAEREKIAFLALNTQMGAAGAGANKAMREAMSKVNVGDTSTAFHMLLGLGSLCLFWPPFAFTCLAIDLSMRAVECAIAFADRDRHAAVEHCKSGLIDIFFIIPYERLGRFAYAGALKADVKLAERGVQTAEKGQAKSTELLGKASENERKASAYKEAIEKQKDQIKRQQDEVKRLEGETWSKEKGSPTIKKKASDSEEVKKYEQAKIDLKKSEDELAVLEAHYAEAMARSQKENPKLIGEAEKFKAEKYNVEDANARLATSKANYTSFMENGVVAETQNLTKLGTLLKNVREKWNTDEFIAIRTTMKAAHNADGTVVTLAGIRDGAVQLSKSGDRLVGESEDFTFCEVVEEAAKSIGQDIKNGVVNLGNSFESNPGFNKVWF